MQPQRALLVASLAMVLAVVGGADATEDYSFMGAYKPGHPVPPGAGGNGCGVTLIDPQWALTAAHCLKNNLAQNGSPAGWTVQVGSPDVTEGGEVAEVDRFFRLPGTGEAWWGKDLMLLRLAEPVTAAPVRVADGSPAAGDRGRILGWGNTSTTGRGSYPEMLQEADVEILANDACPNLSPGELCVGTGDGGDGGKAGNADSGGPLIVRDGDGWALAGVLSGPEDGNDAVAGLYTDVTRHADWITTIMTSHTAIPDDQVDLGMGGFPAIDGCESSVVRTTASREDDPALLLTNGHCVPTVGGSGDMPPRGASLVDRPVDAGVTFQDAQGYGLTSARAERLLLGTVTGTDVAVYRLDRSFAELEADGVTVLRLADAPPRAGDTVTLMTTDPRTCTVEAVVPTLREGGYEQHDALRMAASPDCETFPGSSGAALVAEDGTTVVGVNGTNNRDGLMCEVDNPCEVGEDGRTTVVTNQPYGQQVTMLNVCLTAGSALDLGAPGCDVAAEQGWLRANAPLLGGAAVVAAGAVTVRLVVTLRRRAALPGQRGASAGSSPASALTPSA
ncbi:trypsin-like serine protease [Oerskovia sp. KBS0722]|uniref:trypsin-like serine protease n=1 Tax=Oerskovia sp. KBS0722 TaxID=1179673 RepID=UPI00110E3FFE|nr:trypsin-like serine protease [Oerskovia sp. KBS0722]QDW61464.1 trypsin-like serine protease [Oerskovia sp. KBS0722]